MASVTLFLQHIGLALRLASTHPQLEPAEVLAHAHAATVAATPQISAELLLGMAYVESRFDPLAVSRIEGKHRRVGHYPSTNPPVKLRKGSSLYCGPLQTFAGTWDECMAARNLDVAYATAAKEIGRWLRDRRVRGDMTRALAGYGCGNRGVKTGQCNRYPGRVLWQAKRLEIAKPISIMLAARS
ncbi:MAG TPA: hypothetical protein VFV99_16980 [Kofleriaceae bacterium]|nr:hypothetical protein [Kofleriaceae bacterium]